MEAKQDVISWLLETNNPPVRYLTLTNLLKKPAHDAEVKEAQEYLMDYKATQKIIDHIDQVVEVEEFSKNYWKYTGKYWQLIFLGQLLANKNDPQIDKLANILKERRLSKAVPSALPPIY